jgi:small subunit ribosomal protein S19e
VEAKKFIEKLASELEKMEEMKPPEWAKFVKTGVSRQRPPTQKNWWWIRSASIMRKLYLYKHPIGVERLRNIYGGRKNRGHKPEHKYKASGAIIRNILKQLEKAGFVKTEKGKGRSLTKKGIEFLKKIEKEG